MPIERVSPDDGKHYFFGFHDLCITNRAEDKALMLGVDFINMPPLPGQPASVGFVDLRNGGYVKCGETCAFNYPQGSRLQWWGDGEQFLTNDRVGDHWGCAMYDAGSRKQIATFDTPAHIALPEKNLIFGINYARMFRLGVYGYTGLADPTQNENMPGNDGIWACDIRDNKPELLLSVRDAVSLLPPEARKNEHYFTHLVLSPDHSRIAFLHRHRDGRSEYTRLMTIGVDGSGLRCLGEGSLSHFDWLDATHIMIWGKTGSLANRLNRNSLIALLPLPLLRRVKRGVKSLLANCRGGKTSGGGAHMLLFHDVAGTHPQVVADGVIAEDGHPMFNPCRSGLCVCDNYPDAEGVRTLFLYRMGASERHELGRFRRSFEEPDTSRLEEAFAGMDCRFFAPETLKRLPFWRSGLHCDLHPRWSRDGNTVYFDSIHENRRAVYSVDIREESI